MKHTIRTFLMAAAALGISATATAEGTEIGGLNYKLDDATGTAIVTWGGKCYCSGEAYKGVINIPESVTHEGRTYTVSGIGDYAFSSSKGLKSVSIPESVIDIDKYAFAGCTELESVTFAGNPQVKTIGGKAFLQCKKLQSIEIPASVEKIGNYAFQMCESLGTVTYAEGSKIEVIDDYVFCHTGLTEFSVPASVRAINPVAYCSNPNITEVSLPRTVVKISEQNPFSYNTQVTKMSVEAGNPTYDSRKDCNAIIETATNTLVAGCRTSVIPASVTSIGRSAFNHCTDLTDAALPATIKSISKYAYLGCTGLHSFYFPSTMSVMADSVFWQVTTLDSIVTMAQRPFSIDESDFEAPIYANATLYVPAGTATIYRSAPVWTKFQNIVEMNTFVVDGITYVVTGEGEAQVAPASEGVDYEGTIAIPSEVVSGSKKYNVTGATDDAFAKQDKAVKVVWHAKGLGKSTVVSVFGQKGGIHIDGSDSEAQVYATSGVMMTSTYKRFIPMEQGIYFVKIDNLTFKVIVD